MTRVIPFITTNKKKNSNASIMFQSMDMHDLGLGSLPDLLFTEQLDVVPQQQDDGNGIDDGPVDVKQQQQQPETGLLDGAQRALFKDLEDLNDRPWQPQPSNAAANNDDKVKSAGMKASSTANILSQALTECDLASFITDNKVYIDQLSPAQSGSSGSSSEDDEDDQNMDTQQKLIDDMEEFLTQHEFGANSSAMEDSRASASATALTANESKQAEDILDALIAGNITLDDSSAVSPVAQSPQTNEAVAAAIAQDDSGYLSNISNISEVVTAEGQKVVIIIANDLQQQQQQEQPVVVKVEDSAIQPPASYESDPEWRPDSPKTIKTASRPKRSSNPTWKARKASQETDEVKSGRVEKPASKKRGPYKRSTYQNIKDKKERKKAQNVEAARRYRDKKKLETEGVHSEESVLSARNKELKSKVSEMENEMKTLKKLMVELGLVK